MLVDKKITALVIFGILIGIIAWFLPIQEDIAFEYIVNNTDLYNNGRLQDVIYTANDSAIQLFLIFHALGTGSPIVIDTNLSINGTVVEDRDFRTSAGAGLHEHFSMTAHIPKGANYSVTNSSNLETMEWREYPILTGANGTLSINTTGGGCIGDCDFNNLNINSLSKNDTFNQFGTDIFLSSPFINSDGTDSSRLDLGDGTYSRIITENATYAGSITLNRDHVQIVAGNAQSSTIDVFPSYIGLIADTLSYRFNSTYFDMGGANLTNCANCGGNQNLSQVLAQGNTTNNQSINFTNSGNWLTIGYNSATGLMEVNTASVLYYKQANNLIGYQGGGFAYSAYDNKPMKFSESGTNYSSIVHNATYGTTFQSRGTANNNLNITGFDKVNMYQDTDYNENNLSKVYNIAMNITNGSYNTFTMLGSSSTPFFTAYENGTMRHEMTLGGTQIWKLRGADSAPAEVGYITYSTPGSNPGIAIFNSSLLNRIDIASTNNGFEFYVYPNASSVRPSSPALVINRTQKIVIPAMAGAGDAYACFDSNGALFRKASTCA